jgi:hypothetical protein
MFVLQSLADMRNAINQWRVPKMYLLHAELEEFKSLSNAQQAVWGFPNSNSVIQAIQTLSTTTTARTDIELIPVKAYLPSQNILMVWRSLLDDFIKIEWLKKDEGKREVITANNLFAYYYMLGTTDSKDRWMDKIFGALRFQVSDQKQITFLLTQWWDRIVDTQASFVVKAQTGDNKIMDESEWEREEDQYWEKINDLRSQRDFGWIQPDVLKPFSEALLQIENATLEEAAKMVLPLPTSNTPTTAQPTTNDAQTQPTVIGGKAANGQAAQPTNALTVSNRGVGIARDNYGINITGNVSGNLTINTDGAEKDKKD